MGEGEIVAMNSRVVLKARPEGLVKPDAVEIEEVPISVLQPGQCLVKTISLGVDAFIRTMMDAEAYHGSIAIGGMVPAFGVGTVIGSECPEIEVGTVVSGMLGAQTHAVVDGGSVQPIPAAATRPTDALGPLAMTTGKPLFQTASDRMWSQYRPHGVGRYQPCHKATSRRRRGCRLGS